MGSHSLWKKEEIIVGIYVGAVYGNNAAQNVVDGNAAANKRAEQALRQANNNLSRLAGFAFYTGEPVSVSLDDVDTTPVQPAFPAAPIQPSLSLNLPNFPADISFNQIPQVDFGEVPTFDKEAPSLLFPARPSPSTAVVPDSPVIDTDQDYPDAPVQVLPDVPTLEDLQIPDVPIITLPTFNEVVPTQTIVIPSSTFTWSEDPYSDAMLTAVTSALLERVQGGTGLDVTIENQIWDRSIQREDALSRRAKQELLQKEAQTGFSRPQGSTQAALDSIVQNTQNQSSTLSRDIAIKQAELEQSNMQQTITSIISLEQQLISHFDRVQDRALEAEKFSQQIFFDIYNAEVAKYNVELETYRAYVLAYETQLRAELTKLEVYKGELEGQRLVGELNQQLLQVYTAELSGLQTEVNLYKTQLEAINTRLSAENLKISVFKSEVDAFNSQIQAKNSEYQGYSTAVSAEATKMDAYTSEVRAFASRVDAYSKGIDADRVVSDVAIETEKLRVTQQSLKLDTYSKTVSAEVSAFQAQTLGYQGATTAYGAEVGAESARIQAETTITNQKIAHAQIKAQIALENAKINLANIEASAAQGLEALKATADVSASLASSSLAGLSNSSSVSHGLSLDNSLSESYKPGG